MILSFFSLVFLSFLNLYLNSYLICVLMLLIAGFFIVQKNKYIVFSLILLNVLTLFLLSTNIDKKYLKNKLYDDKKTVNNKINRLKNRIYQNRKKIFKNSYPKDSDLGYYIYKNNKL